MLKYKPIFSLKYIILYIQNILLLRKKYHARSKSRNGINQTGYQLWITPFALDALHRIDDYRQQFPIIKKIASLSSLPRALTHLQNRRIINVYKAPIDKYVINYAINNGRITIYDIDFNDAILLNRNKQEKPQLYHVQKTKGGWTTRGLTNTDVVKTPLAAVNGQSNNLKKATWLMAEHLEHHHGKTFREFTLFHNPTEGSLKDTWESMLDEMGRTTDTTLAFSTVLADVQKSERPVEWLAHNQGALIICGAARVLIKQGIKNLDKNSVIFDGGANSRGKTDPVIQAAGIRFRHNSAPNDLVHHIAGANAQGLHNVVASLMHTPRILAGTTESSAHTPAYKGGSQRFLSLKYGVKNPGLVKQAINLLAARFWDA